MEDIILELKLQLKVEPEDVWLLTSDGTLIEVKSKVDKTNIETWFGKNTSSNVIFYFNSLEIKGFFFEFYLFK